ncbi:S-layer homology domain-containing protein [Paenibacillus sp. strain BS8-2]
MVLHQTWKKIMTGALVFSLIAGSGTTLLTNPVPVSADVAVTARTTPFTDMPNGHWAEKHVAKLSLQGIITGYQNPADGTFAFSPEKSISQQEAVLLALRFAGLVDKVDHDTLIVFGEGFNVDEFFKAYIDLAFSEGLLDSEEEYQIAAADPSTAWGSKPASREWVTKLIVKAIGQEAAASQLEDAPSTFEDADDIQSRYLGFVNAAYQLGLIKGVTETEFAPKSNVNRASLATLFSRAQSSFPVDYPNQVSGIATNMSADSVTVYDSGEYLTYTLDDNTLYYHFNTDKPITRDQLLEYGDVTVIGKDGKALYIEVQGDVQHTQTINGTFAQYNASSKVFYLWVNNEPLGIDYSEAMTIKDTDGKTLAIGDVPADAVVTLTQENFGDDPQAISMVVQAKEAVTSMKGSFYDYDAKTIRFISDNEYVTKPLAVGVTVEISGLSNSTLGDLIQDEDQLEISLNDQGQVTKIKVLNRDVKVLAGAQILSYDKAEKFIFVKVNDGQPLALNLTDKTTFRYSGTTLEMDAALSMINMNKNVLIRYTGNNAVSMDFVLDYSGTITEIDAKAKTITLLTSEGYSVKLPYAITTVEWYSRPNAVPADLKTGDTISVSLKLDKVEASAIRVHKVFSYEVVSTDLINKRMTLKTSSNESVMVSLSSVKLLKPDGTAALSSAFRSGDKVEVTYIGSSAIQVREVATSTVSNG